MEETFSKLFRFALRNEASDIHLVLIADHMIAEVRSPKGLVRYRGAIAPQLIGFLKFRADMDLMDSHRPQTGRMNYAFLKRIYELRVAHVKSGNTDNLVIRILNPYFTLKFDTLFDNDAQRNEMIRILLKQQGLVLIAGTTGSGKTTTLYQCLKYLMPRKIVTIEDPIEVRIDGIVQLQVNPQKHFGFDEAIKQVLRHDPNIIVIGEIRDEQEAKAAVRVALSGHLVLATIHANSLSKTLVRMRNFNVPKEDLENVLEGILYQRMEVDENGKRKVEFEIQCIQSHEG